MKMEIWHGLAPFENNFKIVLKKGIISDISL